MKIANVLIVAILILLVISCSKNNNDKVTWKEVKVDAPFDMPIIKEPIFPDRVFDIREFGAVKDDTANNSKAINDAIIACNKSGGGKVLVPKGKWFTGKVHFKSNVNLYLEEGAELYFSDNPEDYLPAVQSSWEAFECYNYSPLLYAFECENIAITGKGTIRAKMDTWKTWFKRTDAHLEASKTLYNMAAKGVPVEGRQMAVGENHFRPQFIQFNRCENILIEDIKIRNSPFWVIHLLKSKSAIVRGLDIFAHGDNNDGIDPEMTQNLLVENCMFDQGDDAIAVKSGRNQDGWRLNTPSKNIVFRNCEIRDGHQLIAIGSELSGGIKNIYVHDCSFPFNKKPNLNNLVFIKTNLRRGGYVDNIYVENIKAGKVRGGVLGIKTDRLYQWRDIVPTYEVRLTKIGNIHLKNVVLDEANIAIDITGEKEQPVENITLENILVKKINKEKRAIVNANNIIEKSVVLGK